MFFGLDKGCVIRYLSLYENETQYRKCRGEGVAVIDPGNIKRGCIIERKEKLKC